VVHTTPDETSIKKYILIINENLWEVSLLKANDGDEKKLKAIEALKQAFPNQDIKISISESLNEEQPIIEVLKTNDKDDSTQALLGLCRFYLENVCRKPRRVKILQILLDNPDISFDEIKKLYNYPSAEKDQDIISNASLFEHLKTLLFLDYVEKGTSRPVRYRPAPQLEIILKLAAFVKRNLL